MAHLADGSANHIPPASPPSAMIVPSSAAVGADSTVLPAAAASQQPAPAALYSLSSSANYSTGVPSGWPHLPTPIQSALPGLTASPAGMQAHALYQMLQQQQHHSDSSMDLRAVLFASQQQQQQQALALPPVQRLMGLGSGVTDLLVGNKGAFAASSELVDKSLLSSNVQAVFPFVHQSQLAVGANHFLASSGTASAVSSTGSASVSSQESPAPKPAAGPAADAVSSAAVLTTVCTDATLASSTGAMDPPATHLSSSTALVTASPVNTPSAPGTASHHPVILSPSRAPASYTDGGKPAALSASATLFSTPSAFEDLSNVSLATLASMQQNVRNIGASAGSQASQLSSSDDHASSLNSQSQAHQQALLQHLQMQLVQLQQQNQQLQLQQYQQQLHFQQQQQQHQQHQQHHQQQQQQQQHLQLLQQQLQQQMRQQASVPPSMVALPTSSTAASLTSASAWLPGIGPTAQGAAGQSSLAAIVDPSGLLQGGPVNGVSQSQAVSAMSISTAAAPSSSSHALASMTGSIPLSASAAASSSALAPSAQGQIQGSTSTLYPMPAVSGSSIAHNALGAAPAAVAMSASSGGGAAFPFGPAHSHTHPAGPMFWPPQPMQMPFGYEQMYSQSPAAPVGQMGAMPYWGFQQEYPGALMATPPHYPPYMLPTPAGPHTSYMGMQFPAPVLPHGPIAAVDAAAKLHGGLDRARGGSAAGNGGGVPALAVKVEPSRIVHVAASKIGSPNAGPGRRRADGQRIVSDAGAADSRKRGRVSQWPSPSPPHSDGARASSHSSGSSSGVPLASSLSQGSSNMAALSSGLHSPSVRLPQLSLFIDSAVPGRRLPRFWVSVSESVFRTMAVLIPEPFLSRQTATGGVKSAGRPPPLVPGSGSAPDGSRGSMASFIAHSSASMLDGPHSADDADEVTAGFLAACVSVVTKDRPRYIYLSSHFVGFCTSDLSKLSFSLHNKRGELLGALPPAKIVQSSGRLRVAVPNDVAAKMNIFSAVPPAASPDEPQSPLGLPSGSSVMESDVLDASEVSLPGPLFFLRIELCRRAQLTVNKPALSGLAASSSALATLAAAAEASATTVTGVAGRSGDAPLLAALVQASTSMGADSVSAGGDVEAIALPFIRTKDWQQQSTVGARDLRSAQLYGTTATVLSTDPSGVLHAPGHRRTHPMPLPVSIPAMSMAMPLHGPSINVGVNMNVHPGGMLPVPVSVPMSISHGYGASPVMLPVSRPRDDQPLADFQRLLGRDRAAGTIGSMDDCGRAEAGATSALGGDDGSSTASASLAVLVSEPVGSALKRRKSSPDSALSDVSMGPREQSASSNSSTADNGDPDRAAGKFSSR